MKRKAENEAGSIASQHHTHSESELLASVQTTQPSEQHSKYTYEPEAVKPEWLILPTELQDVDFHCDNDAAAWGKHSPYNPHKQLRMTPLDTPPLFTDESPALCFYIHGLDGRARAGTLHFPNGGPPVPTPRFMPVGTKGTLKGVMPDEIAAMSCPIILANTYHLAIQPGTELIDSIFGGLHNFMGGTILGESKEDETIESTMDTFCNDRSRQTSHKRHYNLLTDSGGFQMVSLAALSQVTEEGVIFESPYTGEPMMLRPEDSIKCQNEIGADIIMQLDDVISSVATNDDRFRIATFRTLRWYDRCVDAHRYPKRQNLYPIMQGHLDVSKGGLRELCLAGFRHRDLNQPQRIPGFAIGGLAGGESKDDFWKVVDHACRHLPDDRPRYLMGVGYPLDLVICTALGVDQYDCVYPTRTARFGVALVDEGQMKLKQHEFAPSTDDVVVGAPSNNNGKRDKASSSSSSLPIDPDCPCEACRRGVSRGRLHALLKANNSIAIQLLTQHNVTYMMGLVNRMRQAIVEGKFGHFVRQFMKKHFPPEGKDMESTIPQWVQDALNAAGVSLNDNAS
jgi:queuine/archaeosine tRNA-ribosyltransferase